MEARDTVALRLALMMGERVPVSLVMVALAEPVRSQRQS